MMSGEDFTRLALDLSFSIVGSGERGGDMQDFVRFPADFFATDVHARLTRTEGGPADGGGGPADAYDFSCLFFGS